MSEPSKDFERCPGNSPFCLRMVEYDCCGTRSIQDDILSQTHDVDDSEDFEIVRSTVKKQKLSLHLSKERKKVLSPSSRFNTTVSNAEVEKSSKGCVPKNTSQGKISCKFLHVLCTERALKMSPFLQETCKNCARNFTFLAQFLASSKNLVRNLQGARILHVKCPFSCSVSRILQDIFPWVPTALVGRYVYSISG